MPKAKTKIVHTTGNRTGYVAMCIVEGVGSLLRRDDRAKIGGKITRVTSRSKKPATEFTKRGTANRVAVRYRKYLLDRQKGTKTKPLNISIAVLPIGKDDTDHVVVR